MTVTTHQASSAKSFAQSLGVNLHLGAGGQANNTSLILSELSYLGISNIRAPTPVSSVVPLFTTLSKAHIRFLLQESSVYSSSNYGVVNIAQDVQEAAALQAAAPGSIIGIEGVNEYDHINYTLNGVNSIGNLAWGVTLDKALQAAVRANSSLAGIPVVAASAISTYSLPSVGAYVNASNVHVYGPVGQQLQTLINTWVAAARASAPGDPVYITETGISSSGFNTSTWGGGVADAPTEGLIDTNALLDGYAAGVATTFLYELMDDPSAGSAMEQHFGLFNADGTPKPAAFDIGNLTHILQDAGQGAGTPGTLAYDLAGLPSTASSMLLEKSDGTFDIVIWNGKATLYNGTSVVTPPTSNVTLTLANSFQSIKIFDPVKGSAAIQSLTNASTVTVGLSADPIIIQIAPNSTSGGATNVSDTAAHVGAELDTLQAQAAAGKLGTITLTDSAKPTLWVTASQLASDATALGQIISPVNLNLSSAGAGRIALGGSGQTVTGGVAGKLTVVASAVGGDRVVDPSGQINGDTIEQFSKGPNNVIDMTNMNFKSSMFSATFSESADHTGGTLKLTDGSHTASVTLLGQYMAAGWSGAATTAGFSLSFDGVSGTNITHPVIAHP